MIRSRRSKLIPAFSLVVALACGANAASQAVDAAVKRPIPLVFDTDMGNDIDDALALG